MTRAAMAILLGVAISESVAGTATNVPLEVAGETDEAEWEFSLSTSTYLVQHGRDYTNPIFTGDRDWLHVEARYNYEAIKNRLVLGRLQF